MYLNVFSMLLHYPVFGVNQINFFLRRNSNINIRSNRSIFLSMAAKQVNTFSSASINKPKKLIKNQKDFKSRIIKPFFVFLNYFKQFSSFLILKIKFYLSFFFFNYLKELKLLQSSIQRQVIPFQQFNDLFSGKTRSRGIGCQSNKFPYTFVV